MSQDEVMVLVASVGLAAVLWGKWYRGLLTVRNLTRPNPGRLALALILPLCLAGLAFVLNRWAAEDVTVSRGYQFLYVALGAAWIGLGIRLSSLLDISARDDVAERRNVGAAMALCGAVAGLTCCYAGANLGEGPGWWVVVFAAALSTGGLLAAWLIVELATSISEAVTVERDAAAGLRLGLFLLACGLILGRAVAGNWESAGATVRDFASLGWPAAAITAAELAVGRLMQGGPARAGWPLAWARALPGLLYLALAVLMVAREGWW